MPNLKVDTGSRQFTIQFPNWFKSYDALCLWQCVENFIFLSQDEEYDLDFHKQRKNEKNFDEVINFTDLVDFQTYKNRVRAAATPIKGKLKPGQMPYQTVKSYFYCKG